MVNNEGSGPGPHYCRHSQAIEFGAGRLVHHDFGILLSVASLRAKDCKHLSSCTGRTPFVLSVWFRLVSGWGNRSVFDPLTF